MTDLTSRLSALERTVAELTDHRDICRLIASYGPLVDTANSPERATAVAALWSEDGLYDIGAIGAYKGREAIAACFEPMHFGLVNEGVCHVMAAPHVQIDGDRAKAISYSTIFRPEGDRFYVWRVAANVWDLQRNEGRWEVTSRINRLMTGSEEALRLLRQIDTSPERRA
jgi:hypothetical protein